MTPPGRRGGKDVRVKNHTKETPSQKDSWTPQTSLHLPKDVFCGGCRCVDESKGPVPAPVAGTPTEAYPHRLFPDDPAPLRRGPSLPPHSPLLGETKKRQTDYASWCDASLETETKKEKGDFVSFNM